MADKIAIGKNYLTRLYLIFFLRLVLALMPLAFLGAIWAIV